jgi:hypothetical protein
VQINEVTDNCQPQPETSLRPGRRAVSLAKAIENKRQKLGLDADAGVGYRHAHLSALILNVYTDPSLLGSEFGGVAEKIPEDLLQTVWVAHHRTGEGTEIHLNVDLLGL